MRDSLPTIFRWYVTFGRPDVNRLRKTSELAGFKLDGDLPKRLKDGQGVGGAVSRAKGSKGSVRIAKSSVLVLQKFKNLR